MLVGISVCEILSDMFELLTAIVIMKMQEKVFNT